MKCYYGLLGHKELTEICKEVVKVLGGGEAAERLILETAIAETIGGTYRSPVRYHFGLGLCQFDKIAFEDVKERTSSKRQKAILERFNIDIKQVEYRELAYSPILSLICCRLFYLMKPGSIPATLQERGEYWKKYYNTYLGKGTVEGYVKKVNDFERRVIGC